MMKKILFFLLLAVFSLGISAQAPSKKCPVCGLSIPKCQYKGKHPKTKPTPTTPARQQPSKPAKPVKQPAKPVNQPAKPATSKPKPITVSKPTGTIEGHGYVDLGLSVKWATQNVGASSPSDYGDYYAWGETRTKSSYYLSNCFDCLDDEGDSWGIYKIGGKTSISPTSGHDTARENWGGSWRMPTIAEFEELCNKCDWTWIWTAREGGHNGYKVTGPNGNSIFLPADGYRYSTDRNGNFGGGYYWSSTLSSSDSHDACMLDFSFGDHYTSNKYRCYGISVRPVTD